MLFSSEVFIFFFLPAVLIVHHLCKKILGLEGIIVFLTVASLVFYGAHHPPYIALILGSVVFNYIVGRKIQHLVRARLTVLLLAVCVNLILLGVFKYSYFIVTNINFLTHTETYVPEIVLPLAISFFTFQQIAFLVDVYKGTAKVSGFRSYSLFIIFFPQLIAGPIVRYHEIVPQFSKLTSHLESRLGEIATGLSFFAIGLCKKNLIADQLSLYADPLFNAANRGEVITFGETWTSVLAFGFQIYFDFSAYSDMAIGLARLLGISLPVNFNSPYKATSIIDFWRRWHITLSRFLRDYLYIPLGGNRGGPVAQYFNIMLVMLLGGLWHGAAWAFVIWGGIHGFSLVINHVFRLVVVKYGVPLGPFRYPIVGQVLTFIVVMVAWVPFRAVDLDTTLIIWQTLCGLQNLYLPNILEPLFGIEGILPIPDAAFGSLGSAVFHGVLQSFGFLGGFPILPLAGVICFLCPNSQDWLLLPTKSTNSARAPGSLVGRVQRVFAWRPNAVWAILMCFLAFFALAQNKNPQVFVYFQF